MNQDPVSTPISKSQKRLTDFIQSPIIQSSPGISKKGCLDIDHRSAVLSDMASNQQACTSQQLTADQPMASVQQITANQQNAADHRETKQMPTKRRVSLITLSHDFPKSVDKIVSSNPPKPTTVIEQSPNTGGESHQPPPKPPRRIELTTLESPEQPKKKERRRIALKMLSEISQNTSE